MAKRPIVHEPNTILRARTVGVPSGEVGSAKTQRLISDMKATLAAAPDGVGLAAPQVSAPLKIFLISEEAVQLDTETRMDTNEANKERSWQYFVFINPVLQKRSRKKIEMAEGCLSLPGKFGIVPRSEKIYLEWLDEHGKKHSRGFTKFLARVIQHELDHLDGVLIVDRAKRMVSVPKQVKP